MSLNKVYRYMDKYADGQLPKADSTRVNLEGGRTRIKGSKLEAWRIKSLEGGVCGHCDTQVARLTVDHIVPISLIASFDNAFEIAVNDEENFQFLCEICNRAKSSVLDMRNPKTAKLLLKYITPYLEAGTTKGVDCLSFM